MGIAGLIVYGAFFVLVFLGRYAIDYIEDKELCPCFVKVPLSLIAVGVMVYIYFYTNSSFDGIIWIPFVSMLLVGNFLIGNISNRFFFLENIGIGFFFSSSLYAIGSIWFFHGVPDVHSAILYSSAFGLYFISSFYLLGLKLKEVWHEYLYILGIFGVLIFSIQGDVGMLAPVGIGLFLYSEIVRQISRFKDDEVITDYQSAMIYLVAIAILTAPKFIY